jgi:SnoaL-like protein
MSDLRLPDHVANFFRAYAEQDTDALLNGVAPDATLIDEGREWHGVAEIRGWDEQKPAQRSSIEPTESAKAGADTEVSATVTGAFPGSPITLRFRFTADPEARITSLTIVP